MKCSTADCDVIVHPTCYYGSQNPDNINEAEWKCDACQASNGLADEFECALCPCRGGPLKKLHPFSGATGDIVVWIHAACLLWQPEVLSSNDGKINLLQLPSDAFNSICYLCKLDGDNFGSHTGMCVNCAHEDCKNEFHVGCGMRWNLFRHARFNRETMAFNYFCHEHVSANDIDANLMFELNEWEQWRMKLTMHSDIHQDDISMPVEEYSKHDQLRNHKIQQLRLHHEQLLIDQMELVNLLERREIESAKRAIAIKNAKSEHERWTTSLNDLQKLLLTLFVSANEYGFDWSSLSSGSEYVNPNNVFEQFLQFNQPAIAEYGASDSHLFQLPTVSCEYHYVEPNLSSVSGVPKFMPKHTQITSANMSTCEGCKCRSLPITAPVLPAYRDTMISCNKCSARYHLCCLPDPKFQLSNTFNDLPYTCLPCIANTDHRRQRRPSLLSKATPRPAKSSASVLNFSEMEDEDFSMQDISARKKKNRKSQNQQTFIDNSSTETLPSTSSSNRKRQRSSTGSAASGFLTNSAKHSMLLKTQRAVIKELDLPDDISMTEARQSILAITGPKQPQFPECVLRMQQVSAQKDANVRSLIFEKVSPEDWEQVRRAAMYRIITNIPKGAGARDIAALKAEGEQYSFGRFADSFSPAATPGNDRGENMEIDSAQVEKSQPGEMSTCESESEYEYVGTSTRPRRSKPSVAKQQQSNEDESAAYSTEQQMSSMMNVCALKIERAPSKWDGDLYKPFWTRGNGKAKEGYCSLCVPGQWLKTKTSVYWYHMHNFHGISSISGDFFTPPLQVRRDKGTGLKEGLCGYCNKWISIQADKHVNVNEIYWFKHAQKCHKYDNGENQS